MPVPSELQPIEAAAAVLPVPWNLGVIAALELVGFFVNNGKDPKAEIERLTTLAAQAIIDA